METNKRRSKRGGATVAKTADLVARTLGATMGAYAASFWFARSAARMLPMAPAEAVLLSSLLGLLLIVGLAIWSFSCRTVGLLWLTLSGVTLVSMAAALWRLP